MVIVTLKVKKQKNTEARTRGQIERFDPPEMKINIFNLIQSLSAKIAPGISYIKTTTKLQKFTNKKTLTCSECYDIFHYKTTLRSHLMKVHGHMTPYVCSFCGKKFPEKSQLESLERTHTKEKPYSCVVCCKSFKKI